MLCNSELSYLFFLLLHMDFHSSFRLEQLYPVSRRAARSVVGDRGQPREALFPPLDRAHLRGLSSRQVLMDNKFSRASDVWAFGILVHEVMSGGSTPYAPPAPAPPAHCRVLNPVLNAGTANLRRFPR